MVGAKRVKSVRSLFAAFALSAISLLVTGSHANAITYTFVNVALTDGGVLNGNFTTNVYGAPATWNLTTSGGILPSETYANPPNDINAIALPNFSAPTTIDFFSNAEGYFVELQLAFSGNVMDGASLVGGFECHGWICPSDVTRYIGTLRGEEVTVTPLPAALPLFVSGASLLSFLGWRRKRKVSAAA